MKKVIAWLLVLALTAAVAIGGTLAFLTDRENEANVFTVGDVNIDLENQFTQGIELVPGVAVDDTITITNTGANDAWVWYTVQFKDYTDVITVTGIGSEWDTTTIEGVQLLKAYLPVGESVTVSMKVELAPTVDIDENGNMIKVVDGNVSELGYNVNTLGNPIAYINAYAIQKDNFANVEEAYNAYTTQWGGLNGEKATMVSTAAELQAALAAETDGSIIILAPGTYEVKCVEPSSYKAKNVSIIGTDGAVINGFGVLSYTATANSKIDGLSFKNVTFSGDLYLSTKVMANVTVENCDFINDARIHQDNNQEKLTNLVVKNCTFTGDKNGTKTALMLENTENVTVTGCTFTNIDYNVLQGGILSGTVLLDNNTVNGTGDRVFRFVNVSNAIITISNNTITSNGDASNELAKATDPTVICLTNNKWNGMTDAEVADKLINIDNSAISTAAELVAALASAQNGDTIVLTAGTYDLSALTITNGITLQGAGAKNTVIKANDSALVINASGVKLSDLTIEVAMSGAGATAPITTNNQDLTIENCNITRTTQTAQAYGCLVDVGSGVLTAKNTVFTAPYDPDKAYSDSPSVINATGGVDLDGCTIATDGYGLFAQHVTKGIIKNTKFTGVDNRPTLGVFNCTILDGLVFDGCTFEMGLNSTVAAGNFTVKNSTFDFTHANGATNAISIYSQNGPVVITGNTFKLAAGVHGINLTLADWAPGGHDAAKLTITGNVFENTGASAIRITNQWENVTDALYSNNTFNGNGVTVED